MTIDQKALEDSAKALSVEHWGSDADWRMHIKDASVAITAYLAALPASDHAGLVGRLQAVAEGLKSDRPYAASIAREAATALSAGVRVKGLEAETFERRIHLWFFRNLTNDQREELFRLCFYPAEVGTTHAVQQLALRRILSALSDAPVVTEESDLIKTARSALDDWDRNTCTHESTRRGGTIWTICDDCGRKWDDDRGGFVPYSDPPGISALRAALGGGE